MVKTLKKLDIFNHYDVKTISTKLLYSGATNKWRKNEILATAHGQGEETCVSAGEIRTNLEI